MSIVHCLIHHVNCYYIYLISVMCYTYYSTYYNSIFCVIYYRVVVKINLYQCQCQCQVSFFAYYMGAPSGWFLRLLYGGPHRSIYSLTMWGPLQISFFIQKNNAIVYSHTPAMGVRDHVIPVNISKTMV